MEWEKELKQGFEELLWNLPDRSGIIFSGGLDSSFLAYLINMKDKDVHLYSAGTETSHDFLWTRKTAEILGLPLKFFKLQEDEIFEGIEEIKKIEKRASPLTVLIEIPLYFVCKYSYDDILISGQGADELFLGYKKYETRDSSNDDLKDVIDKEIPMERKIGEKFGKRISYPYLHSSIIDIATSIPYDLKIHKGYRKYILRTVASTFGLNDEISWKPKKASQYSSGIVKAVRKMASIRGKKVYELINDL